MTQKIGSRLVIEELVKLDASLLVWLLKFWPFWIVMAMLFLLTWLLGFTLPDAVN